MDLISTTHIFLSLPIHCVVCSEWGEEGSALMLVTGMARAFDDYGRLFASTRVASGYANTAYRLIWSFVSDFQPFL